MCGDYEQPGLSWFEDRKRECDILKVYLELAVKKSYTVMINAGAVQSPRDAHKAVEEALKKTNEAIAYYDDQIENYEEVDYRTI